MELSNEIISQKQDNHDDIVSSCGEDSDGDDSDNEQASDFPLWKGASQENENKAKFNEESTERGLHIHEVEQGTYISKLICKCLNYLHSIDVEKLKSIPETNDSKEGKPEITGKEPIHYGSRELSAEFHENINSALEIVEISNQKAKKKLCKVYLEKRIFDLFFKIWQAKPFWERFSSFQRLGIFYKFLWDILIILISITDVSKAACKQATESGKDPQNSGKIGIIQAILYDLNRPICQIEENKNQMQQKLIRDYHMLITNIVQRDIEAKEQIRNAGGIDICKATLRSSRFAIMKKLEITEITIDFENFTLHYFAAK